MNTQPLNSTLYAALRRAFGKVKIANQGQPYKPTVTVDPTPRIGYPRGRKQVKTFEAGEEYCVCCPECGDTRFRLWINHRFNTNVENIKMSRLAICYNENCQQNFGFWRRLNDKINLKGPMTLYIPKPITAEEAQPKPTPLPGVCVPLHELEQKNPAHFVVQYVKLRGFSAQELGANWGVGFCEYSTSLPAENRLIFPVYDVYNNQVVIMNWQARYVTEELVEVVKAGQSEDRYIKSKKGRKYYNAPGAKLKWHIYNGWRARQHNAVVVICEGVFDALRVGPELGIALFGKHAKETQIQQLWKYWGSKNAIAIIGLDPDAGNARQRLIKQVSNWSKIITLELPQGTDLGALPRNTIIAMIKRQLI